MGNAATGSPKGEGRADNYRIANAVGKPDSWFQLFKNFTFRNRLMDFFHGFLKQFSVFCMLDCVKRGTQQLYAVLFQYTGFCQLNRHVKTYLTAQGGQQCIRSFLLNNFGYELQSDWFDIHSVGNIRIGHNRGWIAVYQNNLHAFFPEGTACLSTSIVEFSSLADYDWARSNDQYLFYIRSFHFLFSSIICANSLNK